MKSSFLWGFDYYVTWELFKRGLWATLWLVGLSYVGFSESLESIVGSWDSLLIREPNLWSKGCDFESQQKQQENFPLQSQLCMLTLIRCLVHPCVTTLACKRPRSFCRKCRWQVTPKHAYTHDPSKSECADYAAVQAECGNLSGNEPTCSSSGNTRSQSSQLAEPPWTDPGLNSGISLYELISTLKKKKKCRWGMNCGTFSQCPRIQGKSCQKAFLFGLSWIVHIVPDNPCNFKGLVFHPGDRLYWMPESASILILTHWPSLCAGVCWMGCPAWVLVFVG